MNQTIELTDATLHTFKLYASDAGNWGDRPWVSNGNIECSKEMRGNLSDLVKKGLIKVVGSGKSSYVEFTAAGSKLAAELGWEVAAKADAE